MPSVRNGQGILGTVARLLETYVAIDARVWGALWRVGEIAMAIASRVLSPFLIPTFEALGSLLLWLADNALAGIGLAVDNIVVPALNALVFALDNVLALLDLVNGGLAKVGGVLGIDLSTTGAEAATAGPAGRASMAPTAAAATLTSMFAPTAADATSRYGGAPASTPGASVTIQGNTYSISGTGWTQDDVLALIHQAEQERARATSAALEGGEV